LISGRDQKVHYASLYDNKILRKFNAGADVTDVSMSPANDSFLASAKDTVRYVRKQPSVERNIVGQPFVSHYTRIRQRLFSLQEAGCVAKMNLPAGAQGAHGVFDDSG
jgi:predicted TIM-barrel enzyme